MDENKDSFDFEDEKIPADRDIPSVASPPKSQRMFMAVFLMAALVAMIYVVWDGINKNKPKSLVDPLEVTFSSSGSASGPYIEPDPVEPPAEALLPQHDPNYDPLAAQKELALQQEALRMAREQQKKLEQRLLSPQLVYDQTNNPGTSAGGQTVDGGTSGATLLGGGDADANVVFANQYSNLDVETVQANQLQNLHALIPQGTMIPGILETAIQSDLPGMVRAIVSQDVYSFNGSHLLISKGSKLIGRYRSGLVRGQGRVFVIWNRLIRTDGVSVNIGSYGTDDLGRSGLDGEVDTHFFERFGSSVLLSLIDAGLQIGVESLDDTDSATVALESGSDFSKSAEIALENSIAIPPTIHIDQGKRIKVFVGKDLDFSQVAGNIAR